MGRRDVRSGLGHKIDAALDELGISVNELARRLSALSGQKIGNTRSYVYRWLREEGISEAWARRLSEALEKPPEHFIPEQPPPTPEPPSRRALERHLAALETRDDTVDPGVVEALRLLARRLDVVESRVVRLAENGSR